MTRARKVTKRSFYFNEAQGRSVIIARSIENEIDRSTNPDHYDDGDIDTRYEITITVRELGDWNET